MNFTSQICTTKIQSERLLALGLKKETVDMCWNMVTLHGTPVTYPSQESWLDYSFISDNHFPAWSLHRLIEILPDSLFDLYALDFSNRGIFYADFRGGSYSVFEAFANSDKTLYDNIIDCIEWLIQEKHFSKEYLNQ